MKILVSACLLGENCRYKGDNCKNEKVLALKGQNELIAVRTLPKITRPARKRRFASREKQKPITAYLKAKALPAGAARFTTGLFRESLPRATV